MDLAGLMVIELSAGNVRCSFASGSSSSSSLLSPYSTEASGPDWILLKPTKKWNFSLFFSNTNIYLLARISFAVRLIGFPGDVEDGLFIGWTSLLSWSGLEVGWPMDHAMVIPKARVSSFAICSKLPTSAEWADCSKAFRTNGLVANCSGNHRV